MKAQGFAGRALAGEPEAAPPCRACRAFASVADLPEAPDVAIIAVPGRAGHPGGGGRSARKGCRAVIVFTAGFAEVDEAGRGGAGPADRGGAPARHAAARAELPRPVQRRASASTRTFSASFEKGWPIPGGSASPRQSGAYGTHVFAAALDRGIGTPVCITTGNEADVALGDVLGWMAQAPEVEVICAYAEGIRESDALPRGARAGARATASRS